MYTAYSVRSLDIQRHKRIDFFTFIYFLGILLASSSTLCGILYPAAAAAAASLISEPISFNPPV